MTKELTVSELTISKAEVARSKNRLVDLVAGQREAGEEHDISLMSEILDLALDEIRALVELAETP